MCGLAGILSRCPGDETAASLKDVVYSMARALIHRGPDDDGVWVDETGVALAHRRLSIQDLSACGHQPMHSACDRYVVTFNGEIYNFPDLQLQLEGLGATFSGHSDTEVLLAAISYWGIEKSLQRFNGMFAFALWDKKKQMLTLARDRIGKKPLYYGRVGSQFVFASELKALTRHPLFNNMIDPDALSLYLQYNYVPAPYSIYKNIYKLPQGCMVSVTHDDLVKHSAIHQKIIEYWSPYAVAKSCMAVPFIGTEGDAIQMLDDLLCDSVRMRMISDVPVGVLLSGGIDSSTVTAIAQAQSKNPVNSFSIGFSGCNKSETAAAKKIATHLGTNHTELYVSGTDALNILPQIPQIFDEPFGDSSQVPTCIVSRLARSKVTVALTGDGGDELFYGYKRYLSNRKLWGLNRSLPGFIRRPLGNFIAAASHLAQLESRSLKHVATIRANHILDLYQSRICKFINPDHLVKNSHNPVLENIARIKSLGLSCSEAEMMLMDFTSFLTDDVLVKVDRASMAVSLEVRNPVLDYRIVEFAWSLPVDLRFRGGKGKHVLRKVLKRYVPTMLTDRPKQGFGSPVRSWINGPLRDWAEDLLSEERLDRDGIFNTKPVRQLWLDCQKNHKKSYSRLWTVLMFQAWYQHINSASTD
ncbi:MAG: asparagine synthase (glutamine-hydrolyzing) [Gammaproteobacteria bacterium]|nr:asparagine synthase (glutamine-hydrolyzing) [Gammaproteobacteria bacterium]